MERSDAKHLKQGEDCVMITQRFRPVLWVGGAALAAASLYLISLQVANEHKRLEAINLKIQATQHEIGQLNTEFITRANERQLEKWNSSDLALATPRAGQYLHTAAELDHLDAAKLDNKADAPAAAMALVTSDTIQTALKSAVATPAATQPTAVNVHQRVARTPPAHVTPSRPPADRGILLEQALAMNTGARPKQ
jgi:hypothetical protein